MPDSSWLEFSLQLILTLLGMIVTVAVAWRFFVAQQKNDLSSIRSSLNNMNLNVQKLQFGIDVKSDIDIVSELARIRETVGSLDTKVDDLRAKIVGEVHTQQTELFQSVQDQFSKHVAESRDVLQVSVQRELGNIQTQDRATVTDKLLDMVMEALNAMGRFQREAIEQESRAVLRRVEHGVGDAVEQVATEVSDLQKIIDAIRERSKPPGPTALPPSSQDG